MADADQIQMTLKLQFDPGEALQGAGQVNSAIEKILSEVKTAGAEITGSFNKAFSATAIAQADAEVKKLNADLAKTNTAMQEAINANTGVGKIGVAKDDNYGNMYTKMLADEKSYYEQVKYDDSNYIAYKKELIKDEVAAMSISNDQKLSLERKLNAELQAEQKKHAESFKINMLDIFATLNVAGMLTNTLQRAFSAIIDPATNFGQSMANVSAVMESTKTETEAMSQAAMQMGGSVKGGAIAAADALETLGSAGFNATSSVAALPKVMLLAKAGAMELAAASDIASNVLQGFNKPVSELGNVVDVLAKTAAASNANVSDLGQSFRTVSGVASSSNQSIEDMSAVLGTLANRGIKAEVAGDGVKQMLNKLIAPSGDAAKTLDVLSASVGKTTEEMLKTSDGKMRSLIDIFGDLGKAGMTAGQAIAVFGEHTVTYATTLANGAENLKQLRTEINNCAGAAQKMADTKTDTLQGEADKMKAGFLALTITIGEKLIPALKVVASALGGLTNFFREHGAVLGVVAGAVAGVGIAALIYAGQVVAASEATAAFMVSVKALSVAIIANPIGLLATAIGAVAGAFIFSSKEADKFSEKTKEIDRSIAEEQAGLYKLTAVYETLKNKTNLTTTEKELLKDTIKKLQDAYPEYLKNIDLEKDGLDKVKTALSQVNESLVKKKALQMAMAEMDKYAERQVNAENALRSITEQQVDAQKKLTLAEKEYFSNKSEQAREVAVATRSELDDLNKQALQKQREINDLKLIMSNITKAYGVDDPAKKDAEANKKALAGNANKVATLSKQEQKLIDEVALLKLDGMKKEILAVEQKEKEELARQDITNNERKLVTERTALQIKQIKLKYQKEAQEEAAKLQKEHNEAMADLEQIVAKTLTEEDKLKAEAANLEAKIDEQAQKLKDKNGKLSVEDAQKVADAKEKIQEDLTRKLDALYEKDLKNQKDAIKKELDEAEKKTKKKIDLAEEERKKTQEKLDKGKKEISATAGTEDKAADKKKELDDTYEEANQNIDKLKELDIKGGMSEVEAVRKANAEKLALKKEYTEAVKVLNEEESKDFWDKTTKKLEIAQMVYDGIAGAVSAYYNIEQTKINNDYNDKKKSLDKNFADEKKTLSDKLKNKQITDAQYNESVKALENKKAEDEAKLEEDKKSRERSYKEQQKVWNIGSAIMNTAVGVTKAFATEGILGLIMAGIIAAQGAMQVALISAQKFATGGLIPGRSHAEGGVPFTVGGQAGFEAEGGEYIVRKSRVAELGTGFFNFINAAPLSQLKAWLPSLPAMEQVHFYKPAFADGGEIIKGESRAQAESGLSLSSVESKLDQLIQLFTACLGSKATLVMDGQAVGSVAAENIALNLAANEKTAVELQAVFAAKKDRSVG